jgi:UDP-N-acetylglucosamine--N-acetylmuramyl-(pentapeptide) pyrophosphoryl-undecaprenol N-acetylglucosamine transferase
MSITIVITAGGTGGHIFPALSTAFALRSMRSDVSLLWIGTPRSREKELCDKNGIPVKLLRVSGLSRESPAKAATALLQLARAVLRMVLSFSLRRPRAVLAFGGYVCAPVLTAATILRIPFYLHEQNTVPGKVNRVFSWFARCSFLGLSLYGRWKLHGRTRVVGNPVRQRGTYDDFAYPEGLDRKKRTILICGGSQGAQSMNRGLVEPAKRWTRNGLQMVWQTGVASYKEIVGEMSAYPGVFVFDCIDDLYPYYAQAVVLIGRAGASTLAEAALFGLPCILIPLPWAADNHQWLNASLIKTQGWGIRIQQDIQTGNSVDRALASVLSHEHHYDIMRKRAFENSPAHAAEKIADHVLKELAS